MQPKKPESVQIRRVTGAVRGAADAVVVAVVAVFCDVAVAKNSECAESRDRNETTEIREAPRKAAHRPAKLTPPFVPTGTLRKFVIKRGFLHNA